MRRETFIMLWAMCALVLACAKSPPRTQAVSSPQQTQAETTIKPESNTPTLPPLSPTPATPIPTPSFTQTQPFPLQPGQQVRVAVYPGTQPQSGTCMDLLPGMLPVSALDMFRGDSVGCTMSLVEKVRLQFLQDTQGVLYLSRVQLLVLAGPGLPDVHSPLCEDIAQYLLPPSADPRTARGRLVCWSEPQPRGHQHENVIKVWGQLPDYSPVLTFPDGVHCWELTRFLGPARGDGILPIDVACILN